MSDFVFVDMGLNDPNVQAWDGKAQRVEPGEYDFEIEKVEFNQSRKGNTTLVVHGVIVTDGAMNGRKMRNSYLIDRNSDFARARMKSLIDATGCMVDDQGRFAKDSLIGCRFNAEVIMNQFTDMDKNGVEVTKETTKWVGEKPVAGAVAPAPAPAPQQTAQSGGIRRPAAPNGGAQQARR